eukprot:8860764-Heterocapsa_arctica.AAC.1
MTEEDAKKVVEIMVNNMKPELQKIEGRIESLESITSANKEMTEIMDKDAEHIFYKEHLKIRDRIKDMFSHIKGSKKEDTEVSSEEDEELREVDRGKDERHVEHRGGG